MTRRTNITLLAATMAAAASATPKENPGMYQQILEMSMTEKKGVQLYLKGQSIAGIVTKVNADSVEMRSREYSKIIVRLDAIDAAAIA